MINDSAEAVRLRNVLTDRLKHEGRLPDVRVEAAFRAVPRHLFVPGLPLREAYVDQAIPTKKVKGQHVSSLSQPSMIAIMLEQLDLQAGHAVLEIGAGTGYNAALMAHVVGAGGRVFTMDIDQDLVAGARSHLALAGDERVEVICGDGADGCPARAPYDRIILTVGAADIAPAWREQLQPNGRLVLPLDFQNKGAQFSMAFDAAGDYLIARSFEPCGFIRLRGSLSHQPVRDAPLAQDSAFGMILLATVSQVLPKVGDQLWRRRVNRQAFGRPALEGLRLRAYPIDVNYIPQEGEMVHDTRWTRFVIDWADVES